MSSMENKFIYSYRLIKASSNRMHAIFSQNVRLFRGFAVDQENVSHVVAYFLQGVAFQVFGDVRIKSKNCGRGQIFCSSSNNERLNTFHIHRYSSIVLGNVRLRSFFLGSTRKIFRSTFQSFLLILRNFSSTIQRAEIPI